MNLKVSAMLCALALIPGTALPVLAQGEQDWAETTTEQVGSTTVITERSVSDTPVPLPANGLNEAQIEDPGQEIVPVDTDGDGQFEWPEGIDPEELGLTEEDLANPDKWSISVVPAGEAEMLPVRDPYNWAYSTEEFQVHYTGRMQFIPAIRTTPNPGSGLKPFKHIRQGGMDYRRSGKSVRGGMSWTAKARKPNDGRKFKLTIEAWDNLIDWSESHRTMFVRRWVYF